MFNKVIAKTSDEEGKYAEYLAEYLAKMSGYEYRDVSDDAEYQKMDVDALIGNVSGKLIPVEVKNDMIIHKTGNVVYEIYTHATGSDVDRINAWKASQKGTFRIDDMPKCGSIGCNEKCQASKIFYVSTIEEGTTKRYALNFKEPILLIDNRKFQKYVHEREFSPWELKTVFQYEDRAHNVFVIINTNELIKNGIARRPEKETIAQLNEVDGILSKHRTSGEVGRLLGII